MVYFDAMFVPKFPTWLAVMLSTVTDVVEELVVFIGMVFVVGRFKVPVAFCCISTMM